MFEGPERNAPKKNKTLRDPAPPPAFVLADDSRANPIHREPSSVEEDDSRMSAAVARRAFFAARAHRGAAIGRDVSGTRAEEDDEEGTQGTRPRARGGMLEDVVLATREGAGGGEGSEEEGREEGKEEAAALVSLAAAGPWIVAADAAGDAWAWDASARGERFEREVRGKRDGRRATPSGGEGFALAPPPPPFAASDAAPVRRSSRARRPRSSRRRGPFANASTVSSDARRGRAARRPPRVGATRHFFVPVLRREKKK